MGVAGLWDVLRPAAKPRSLTDIAVADGFEKNANGVRGYRLGIDASIWFFHAEYGREGENPVLRTLFFRCATLMKSPFLPLFVFDGPKRPDVKRGKNVSKTPSKMIPGMKAIVEAFGFEYRTAPGEAEAELAYLNRIGVIDGILSDDVDNFLFGAITVIRNPSNTLSGNRANPILNAAGKDDKNHSWVFSMSDIASDPRVGLTRGGFILIGLLSGGDYHQGGIERCGIKTAAALARCGFGDTLYQAVEDLDDDTEENVRLNDFLANWRHELRREITTNSQGFIGRRSPSLAKSITDEFPNIEILRSYTKPITSESMGQPYTANDISWNKEPDISKLAATCEFYFEWGYKEAIIKRFRTVLWHSAVLRMLRRAVLDIDEGKRAGPLPPTTPTKNSHFRAPECATLGINKGQGRDNEVGDPGPLIIKIHSAREHGSTDGIPEYRLEIAPAGLVRLAESGIKGTRQPEGPNEWAFEEDVDDKGGSKKSGGKVPVGPESHMRLWMPACMVRMVEPKLVREFEEEVERKRLQNARKGQGRGKKATPVDDEGVSPPKRKRATKKKTVVPSDDGGGLSMVSKQKDNGTKTTVPTRLAEFSPTDDSDGGMAMPSPATNILGRPTQPKATTDTFGTLSPQHRVGMKDLVKKTIRVNSLIDQIVGPSGTMNSFFPIVKPGRKATNHTKPNNADASSSRSVAFPPRVPAPFPISFGKHSHDIDERPRIDFFSSAPSRNQHLSTPVGRLHKKRSIPGSFGSDTEDRITKSPRKSRLQATPATEIASISIRDGPSCTPSAAPMRSPSPIRTARKAQKSTLVAKPGQTKNAVDFRNLSIIEISSEEEDDKSNLPTPLLPPIKKKALAPRSTELPKMKFVEDDPPFLPRARARAKVNVVAVIDLT